MIDNPLVTIIIPSYNRALLIADTLNSVLAQSYTHWECIIVDDGSTDNTTKKITEYVTKDSRFKLYIRSAEITKGAPSCRNIGIKSASGKYCIFLDSDDLLAPWCLQTRMRFMEDNAGCQFAVFSGLLFRNRMGDSAIQWNINKVERPDLMRFFISDVPWSAIGPIWKTDTFKTLGNWDQSLADWQDSELHVRAIAKGILYKKSDTIPDYFVRTSTVSDGTQISNLEMNSSRILNRAKVFLLYKQWVETSSLNAQTKTLYIQYISSYFFIYAKYLMLNGDAFRPFYSTIKTYKMQTNLIYYLGIIYIYGLKYFRKTPVMRSIIYRLIELFLPNYYVRTNSTFKLIPLNPEVYQELLIKLDAK